MFASWLRRCDEKAWRRGWDEREAFSQTHIEWLNKAFENANAEIERLRKELAERNKPMPSDNPRKKAHDSKLISIRQSHELRWWTRAFGVSSERLREAVKAAGHSAIAVRDYLKSDRWACGEVAGIEDKPKENT